MNAPSFFKAVNEKANITEAHDNISNNLSGSLNHRGKTAID